MEIVLHLGAHRTGTTAIQAGLSHNANVLREHGYEVLVPSHDLAARLAGETLGESRAGDASSDARAEVAALCNGRRLLWSHENLLGIAQSVLKSRLYARRLADIDRIREHLGNSDLRVFFFVRSYAEIVESVYLKYCREMLLREGRAPRSLSGFRKGIRVEDLSWLPVVGHLRSAFGADAVSVCTYESAHSMQLDAFELFLRATGLDELPVVNHKKRPNASPSGVAVRLASQLVEKISCESERRDVVATVLQALPARDYGRAQLLTPEERSDLETKYGRDVAEMRRRGWLHEPNPRDS